MATADDPDPPTNDPPTNPKPTNPPLPTPVPPDPPDDDPPIGLTLRSWLSIEELEVLNRPERRKLRKARRRARNLERWPETEGRPPWLVKAEATALRLTARAVLVLAEAAKRAVFAAAAAVLAGGQLRHEFAVAALMSAVAGEAFDLTKEYASELIADTFEALVDEG